MIAEGKAIINLLNKKGYEAFFIGGKSRNELHNLLHKTKKISIQDIDIVTNASPENIKKIFPSSKETGEVFKAMTIRFADKQFEITTYRKDATNYERLKETGTKILSAGTLDEDREKRDFTINAIVQGLDGKFIDYKYRDGKSIISSIKDIEKQIIRCIGDAETKIREDPLRILRMFRFQSQLGYKIDKATMQAALKYKHLLSDIPYQRLGPEFNKLITGKFVFHTIRNMKRLNFFKVSINNNNFLQFIENISEDDLKVLTNYNRKTNSTNYVEAYSLLLKNVDISTIKEFLSSFMPISENNINRVVYIVKHKELLDPSNENKLHSLIFESKKDIHSDDIHKDMLWCIKNISHIAKVIVNEEYGKKIYHAYCERPYFDVQLRITSQDITDMLANLVDPVSITNNMNNIKEAILKRLSNIEGKWPYNYYEYMEYVKLGINDIFPDINVDIPEELVKIDGYGNIIDHHKAVQFIESSENNSYNE